MAVTERQSSHIGDHGRSILTLKGVGVDVDADGFPGIEQVIAVADAAAQVEDRTRAEERFAQTVGGDMSLPGRIEARLRGDDPLSGDLHLVVSPNVEMIPVEASAPIDR